MVVTSVPENPCDSFFRPLPGLPCCRTGLPLKSGRHSSQMPLLERTLLHELGRGRRGRRETIATHDLHHLRFVRRSTSRGLDHRSHLAEILRANGGRTGNGQNLGIDAAAPIGEGMDCTPRDAERLLRSYLDGHAINSPGGDALQPVDRLLKGIMAMRGRGNLGSRRNPYCKDGHAPMRLGTGHEEMHLNQSKLNRLLCRIEPQLTMVLNHGCLLF